MHKDLESAWPFQLPLLRTSLQRDGRHIVSEPQLRCTPEHRVITITQQ
jgi:hypothetical protein